MAGVRGPGVCAAGGVGVGTRGPRRRAFWGAGVHMSASAQPGRGPQSRPSAGRRLPCRGHSAPGRGTELAAHSPAGRCGRGRPPEPRVLRSAKPTGPLQEPFRGAGFPAAVVWGRLAAPRAAPTSQPHGRVTARGPRLQGQRDDLSPASLPAGRVSHEACARGTQPGHGRLSSWSQREARRGNEAPDP